jgi:hypothetical protein
VTEEAGVLVPEGQAEAGKRRLHSLPVTRGTRLVGVGLAHRLALSMRVHFGVCLPGLCLSCPFLHAPMSLSGPEGPGQRLDFVCRQQGAPGGVEARGAMLAC